MASPEAIAATVEYRGPAALAATDSRHHPCSLTIRAAKGLAAGTRLRVLVSPFRAVLDSQCHDQIVLLDVQASGSESPVAVERRPPGNIEEILAAFVGRRINIVELALPHGTPAGLTIQVELGVKPSPHAGVDVRLDVEACSPPEYRYRPLDAGVVIPVDAGPAVALEYRARCQETAIIASVFARDEYANVATTYRGRVELRGDVPGLPRLVDIRGGHARIRLDGAAPVEGVVRRLEARDQDRGWSAISNPLSTGMPFFGELHFHTVFSGDGGGDLAAAYTYARDVLQLDLTTVTDHTPLDFWDETKQVDDAYDEPGIFVTIPSWEWSTPHGHANVYLRQPEVDAGPERATEAEHPSQLEWPAGTLLIPHHTNIDSSYDDPESDVEASWFEYDWSTRNPAIRLVEIAQCRGNFEADEVDSDWGIVTGGIGASVQDALEQGYRIGFVGGTDNHSGAPTRDSLKPGHYVGLTGVYADELTRLAIWDALWNRRTFATSGVPILGWVRIAGVEMGREARGVTGEVLLDADLHGTSLIERVEVIADRRVVWGASPDSLDLELRSVALPPAAWYYLRLRQRDGHRAWFSPVWVEHG